MTTSIGLRRNSQTVARPRGSIRGSEIGLTAVVVMMGIVLAITIMASETVLRGTLTCCTAIIAPLAGRVATKSVDIFEPITPATAALMSMFVARPIADQVLNNYVHVGYNIAPTFDDTLFAVLVGCIGFSLGYSGGIGASVRRLIPSPGNLFPKRKVTSVALALAVIGLGLFALFIFSSGGLPTLLTLLSGRSQARYNLLRQTSGYLYSAVYLLVPASMLFLAAWLQFGRLRFLVCSLLSAVLILGYALGQGNRIDLLPVVAGLTSVFYLSKNRRPRARNVFVLLVSLLVLSSLVREFRYSSASGGAIDRRGFLEDPISGVAKTFTQDDNEMFDTMANILSVVPSQLGFRPAGVVTDLVTRILPRPLFPDKPPETNDRLIMTLWPWHYRLSRASSASSLFGEFYLYGGLIGVGFGALAIGALFSGVWRWYRANAANPNAILIYAFVPALVIILLRGTIPDTMSRMCFTVFPLVLGQLLWCKASRRKTHSRFSKSRP
jgi:hypothetical protein